MKREAKDEGRMDRGGAPRRGVRVEHLIFWLVLILIPLVLLFFMS